MIYTIVTGKNYYSETVDYLFEGEVTEETASEVLTNVRIQNIRTDYGVNENDYPDYRVFLKDNSNSVLAINGYIGKDNL